VEGVSGNVLIGNSNWERGKTGGKKKRREGLYEKGTTRTKAVFGD